MRAQAKLLVLKLIKENQLDDIMVQVEQMKFRLTYIFLKLFSKNRILTSIYYLFSSEFKREQYSVINGKMVHFGDILNKRNNDYLLRRNIHRIEKGLLMRPRKDVFAARFINETMNSFDYLLDKNDSSISNTQLKWANDVLKEYFRVVGSHPSIDKEKKRYNELKIKNKINNSNKFIPYKRNLEKQMVITLEQLKELSIIRRSVRWFEDKPVPRQAIDYAIEIGLQAPSACNRQPFRYQIFDDPELVKKIAKIPSGTAGFYHNIPTLVAVIGDLTAYPFERDRHLIYIDSSLSIMPFLYGLEVQGLSSCPLNWPDIEKKEKELEKIIRTKKYERVIMFIAVGYPDEDAKVAFSRKKDIDEFRTFNLNVDEV
ncbi:nitroreductase family protein [Metabacillus arenae]|uniref:Nitroreductase family protein n=1 Tax=Metabacillus arenae TaxID=2771434 RepID=A0A926NRJ9_9BACI|nr:nitroreductase family protein [Metabacillus arenae]MBD1382677.1 nitroreductase family protein [Metabacillus arenae]